MKIIKVDKNDIPSADRLKKHWRKWLKRYRQVQDCLKNRVEMFNYAESLKRALEESSVFAKERQLILDAQKLMEHLFTEYFVKKIKTPTQHPPFWSHKVNIEELTETLVCCNYKSDNVHIYYHGEHSRTFPSKARVISLFVDYSPSGTSGISARLFSFDPNN